MPLSSTDAASAARHSTTSECKPLLDIANKHLVHSNPFRIAGLPVDATAREITKHADRLKMMEELGNGDAAHSTAFRRKPPPTVDEIREAMQRLKDPETRLLDEFFWFWPSEFGRSKSDSAIQLLVDGELDAAMDAWRDREADSADGSVATHNLAVAYLVTALDWENYAISHDIGHEQRKSLADYWSRATRRWKKTASDDRLWEALATRIRQLDDARLTTGFGRRMRNSLPHALNKISTDIALAYAEDGRLAEARLHIETICEAIRAYAWQERSETWGHAAESSLAPITTRLREQLRSAEMQADKAPASAATLGKNLLSEAHRVLPMFELLLGSSGHSRADVFDEIAQCCNRLQVTYYKATSDNQTCLALLKEALPLVSSPDLKQQIEENLETVQNNLAFRELKPAYEILNSIEKGGASLSTRVDRICSEVLPLLSALSEQRGAASRVVHQLADTIALALRGLSVSLHNENSDTDGAVEAIDIACEIARGESLKERLSNDRQKLSDLKRERDSHNLRLEIRSDVVEITHQRFRYNSITLPEPDINGVRFGVSVQYTNGVKSSVSYLAAVSSSSHGTAQIECKRWFRSEDLAERDFNAIVRALFYHIIPGICTRLGQAIVAGNQFPLGDCWLKAEGIRVPTGMLFWKEEHVVPWSEVRFGMHQGHLNISSAKNPKIRKSLSLRDVWNAVIFEELAKIIVNLRAK